MVALETKDMTSLGKHTCNAGKPLMLGFQQV